MITESQLEMFQRYEFTRDEWFKIKEKCVETDILFLSTPQNESDLELLHKTMHTIEQEKKVLKAKEAELKKARGVQKLIKDCSNENEKKDVRNRAYGF